MMISCPIIKTHRLLIRPISNIDNIEFFNLLTNPLVAEIAGVDENINIKAIDDSIQYFESLNLSGYYYKWAICLKDQNKFIGECELYPLKAQIRPWFEWGLGFSLSPEFWRNGFMYEALSSIIDYAFNHFEAHRIKADVHIFNDPSKKLLEKLNFKLEGVQIKKISINNKFYDMNLMALAK